MTVTVKDLAGGLRVLAGNDGLDREVVSPQVRLPELSAPSTWKGIASSVMHLTPGQSAYLSSLSKGERSRVISALLKRKPACIVVTGGAVCEELIAKAGYAEVPILKTGNLSKLEGILRELLTPRISLHGVLVRIFEIGTLIIGESAIGKSEAALDLVLRGHKLIADDLVVIEKAENGMIGRPTELGANLLEIRGLGIIDIRALYGESATVDACTVGLVVELEEWKEGQQYSLLGLRERRYKLLGKNLPYMKLPVKPGRNMATLIEVAARNQMLKNKGIFTARSLNRKLKKKMAGGKA